MPGDYGEPVQMRENQPAYPVAVRIAAGVWIVFGAVIPLNVVNGLVSRLISSVNADVAQKHAGEIVVGFAVYLIPIVVFGIAFIFVGYQTLKGSAKDTRSNGFGSLVFGLIILACGGAALALTGNPSVPQPVAAAALRVIAAGIYLLSGIALLGAGVLALVGRQEYKAWRNWNKRRAELRED